MSPVRYGPATRGDMEGLTSYLLSPPPSRTRAQPVPLGDQFHELKVGGVMDAFYRQLQEAIFISLQDDESLFLDAQDWHGKLLESEHKLLESVKRFILHTAIYCSRATNFAFPRYIDEENSILEPSRLEEVDCLQDFVDDVVELAGYLNKSCQTQGIPLPSLKDFIKLRVDTLSREFREGKRRPRRYFFRPNSERTTHVYARKVCCVILGLTDDYDQRPEFGSKNWKNEVLVFDNLEQLLWKGFGLKFKSSIYQDLGRMTGSIVDLDANFIDTGPFNFTRTTRVQEHLTLDRNGNIRIYTSSALASTSYMFQNHIIARYFVNVNLD